MSNYEVQYEEEDFFLQKDEDVKEFENSKTGFTQIPNSLLTNSDLSIQARLLYCNLLIFTWSADFCFPTQDTLSKYMGITSRRIRDILKELERKKFIVIHRHGYSNPNIYELLVFPDSKRFKKTYFNTFGKRKEKSKSKLKKRLNDTERKIRSKRKKKSYR